MWTAKFKTATSEVNAKQFWTVLTDVNNWNKWDDEVEWTKMEGESKLGATFVLKPKGGPKVNIKVTEYQPYSIHTDLTSLPLGKMQMKHVITQKPSSCELEIEIKIWGILGFLWKNVIGKKQLEGFEAQTAKMIAEAKLLKA